MLASMNATCRACRASIPAGQGYCPPCAEYADGYDSGANYCDHFEGTTPASAEKYAEQMETPEGIQYPERYRAGLLAGLTEAAKVNAKMQEEE